MKKATIKRLYLICFFLLLTLSNFGNTVSDTILNKNYVLQYEKLNSKVDSLLKITSKFSEEENYFTTALNSQTMIFSIIITITLFLFGLISYAKMKYEIIKYKKETDIIIERQNGIIEAVKGKNNKHDDLINGALGNLYALIAEYYNANDKMRFKSALMAAKYQQTKEPYEHSIVNLKKAHLICDKDNFDISYKDSVVEETLRILINSKNEEIVKLSLYIYYKYTEVTQNQQQ